MSRQLPHASQSLPPLPNAHDSLARALLGARLGARPLLRAQREFDGVGGRLRAQVVHAGLEPASPRVEVHRGELSRGGGAGEKDSVSKL